MLNLGHAEQCRHQRITARTMGVTYQWEADIVCQDMQEFLARIRAVACGAAAQGHALLLGRLDECGEKPFENGRVRMQSEFRAADRVGSGDTGQLELPQIIPRRAFGYA